MPVASTPEDRPEERIVALEIRLAHQERMAEEMSDVLAEQARHIDRLTLQLRQLRDRLGQVEAGGGGSPQDDRPPPHY